MRSSRGIVIAGCAVLLSACGGSIGPAAQVRNSYARLLSAFRDHDAHTVCELLFPVPAGQSSVALTAYLRKLDTVAGRSRYQANIKECVPSIAKDPRNFTDYHRAFDGLTLGKVTVHGNRATVDAASKDGKAPDLTFVTFDGEWRLLFRFS